MNLIKGANVNKLERLVYVPLGGAGEIGMNMYLYGFGPPGKENYIMIDAGVTFPEAENSPGVNLIMPDDTFIKNNLNRLVGIFISHAHEDHVGAVATLYGAENIPIFSRKFTGQIIRQKLQNLGYDDKQLNIVDTFPEKIKLKEFEVSFIPIPHSIPESSALLIETKVGNIIHSGDFKIDDTPIIGDSIDYDLFERLNKEKFLALMCDSTNVFSKHPGRSESLLHSGFDKLFKSSNGLIVATTFASNLARLKTIATAAKMNGREVCVLGRAMNAMIKAANEVNLLEDGFPNTISPKEARKLPRSKLLILATGSQGEKRAASAQLSKDGYMNFQLGDGDTFVFSSKTIPGNEIAVTAVVNRLVDLGVRVIYEGNDDFHVSGHPNEPDLTKMHEIINAKAVIPIHGEARHLKAHYELARQNGYDSLVVQNGTMIEIDKNGLRFIEKVECGRLFLDGSCLISSNSKHMSDRLMMAQNGLCCVSILIDENNNAFDSVWVKSIGLPSIEMDYDVDEVLEQTLNDNFEKSDNINLADDDAIESFIKFHISKKLIKELDKRPLIQVLISRIE